MASYKSKTAIYNLGCENSEFSEFLAKNKLNPIATLPFATLVKSFRQNPIPSLATSEHEFVINIPMRDGHSNEARIHKAAVRGNALVVLIHGGGFCLGHNSHMNSYSRSIASFFNVNVVSISYRLAPEFKFPTAPNDVWDAIEWLVKQDNKQTFGYEPSAGFLVGGVSAGANLAAVAVRRWGSEKLSPPISGAWLGIPWLMDEDIVPSDYQGLWFSREQNADSFIVGKEALEFMKEAYAPETTSPAFSPLNTKDSYENHPPTYIQVCGKDPLRDDGLIYEKLLREQGVSTRMDVYPGVPHGFADVFPELKIARKYRIDTMKGFSWLLGNEPHERAYAEAFEGIDTSRETRPWP